MLLKLAFRNLMRNRRRTLITLCGITLTLGLLIWARGLMSGIGSQSIKNFIMLPEYLAACCGVRFIDYQTAHFQVALPGYDENKEASPMDYLWENPAEAVTIIKNQKDVMALTKRLSFPLRLNDGENELPCQGVGIDLAGSDEDVFLIKEAVVAGKYLSQDEEEMLLGADLARLFEVEVDDQLTLVVRTRYEAIEALDLKVAGIVKTGNPRIDKYVVFVPLVLAQRLVEAPEHITEIAIKVVSSAEKNLLVVEEDIKKALAENNVPSEVFSWKYLAADFIKLHNFKAKAQAIFLGLIVIIAAVGITNTMLALGMRRNQIMLVFIWEGMLLGVIGSFLGCLWGGLLTGYYEQHGINIGAMGDVDMTYPIRDYMYPELTLGILVSAMVFGVVVTIAASYFPALRASQLNPAQSLRSQ